MSRQSDYQTGQANLRGDHQGGHGADRNPGQETGRWADAWFDLRRYLFVAQVFLETAVRAWRNRAAARRRGEWPVSLREVFERLGLTYLKVGQYLALRLDLLPMEVRNDLEQLFENVRPVEFERIRIFVEQELGASLATCFQEFDADPIAAASIAQVHLAVTASGDKVAVKVQRPDIYRTFSADVKLMLGLARTADFFSLAGPISLTEAVQQFAAWTARELDFIQEGSTAEHMRANSAGIEVIPRIHWDLTSGKVLTLDFIEGISLGNVISTLERENGEGLGERLPGVDLTQAFHDLAQTCLRQIFVDGFFHGDPHPGNILITREGRVAFVDYGIFGELTARQRRLLREYLANLLLGRAEESFQSYSQLFTYYDDSDYQGFRRNIIRVMREWYALATDPAVPYEERLAGKFSDRISAVVRAYRVGMKMDLLLFWRVFIVLDAVAAQLSSRVDLNAEMVAFFRRTETEALMDETVFKEIEQTVRVLITSQPWPAALAAMTDPSSRLPAWIEAPDADEQNEHRTAGWLGLALAGMSASFAIFRLLPSAMFLVLLLWAAVFVILLRKLS
jgi:predicted unusual protein kinase regulating ubiquinone biosynthesis (AarF/ABC1/UbiB family)